MPNGCLLPTRRGSRGSFTRRGSRGSFTGRGSRGSFMGRGSRGSFMGRGSRGVFSNGTPITRIFHGTRITRSVFQRNADHADFLQRTRITQIFLTQWSGSPGIHGSRRPAAWRSQAEEAEVRRIRPSHRSVRGRSDPPRIGLLPAPPARPAAVTRLCWHCESSVREPSVQAD
jgi:hypothetical protein